MLDIVEGRNEAWSPKLGVGVGGLVDSLGMEESNLLSPQPVVWATR